jgi:predicted nucleotidyltransferase
MLQEFKNINNNFISIMKKQKGVIGAWNFGSVSHGMMDEYSDIHIIFLIEDSEFLLIDEQLTNLLGNVCNKVVLCWPEGFNSDAIKNYGYLLEQNGQLFQYDVFLLNKGKLDDFMCKIHYTDLQEKDIIFDQDGSVEELIHNAPTGNLWSGNIDEIVKTYWFHLNMTIKYLLRNDFFKLNGVLRVLMDTHTSLLLTAYDNITWGGTANKLHFIDKDKQEHLKKYGCVDDFKQVRTNLLQSISWFENDVAEIGSEEEVTYNKRLSSEIKDNWIQQTKCLEQ